MIDALILIKFIKKWNLIILACSQAANASFAHQWIRIYRQKKSKMQIDDYIDSVHTCVVLFNKMRTKFFNENVVRTEVNIHIISNGLPKSSKKNYRCIQYSTWIGFFWQLDWMTTTCIYAFKFTGWYEIWRSIASRMTNLPYADADMKRTWFQTVTT